ncbi:MAG: hypothetical protein GX992_04310 [Clostridium sp.]|nr:hypothetical protein [Clostridium sp.]
MEKYKILQSILLITIMLTTFMALPSYATNGDSLDANIMGYGGYSDTRDMGVYTSDVDRTRIAMELDKTRVAVGDIVTATITVNGVENFSAYQVNIKYDPKMLQAIDIATGSPYKAGTFPDNGTILINGRYDPVQAVANDVKNGILNFGSVYVSVEKYRNAGEPEESGLIGKIGFKALSAGQVDIKFEDTNTMPVAVEGTMLFDWHGRKIRNYSVIQPEQITITGSNPTPLPTQQPTPTKGTGPTPDHSGLEPVPPKPTPTHSKIPPSPTPTEIEEPDEEIPGGPTGIHNAYLKGYPDGTFKPEKYITRAEAAVIFANLLGGDENDGDTTTTNYTDLNTDHWAAWAIQFVSDRQLFHGYPDGSFKPNRNITRAEFATVVFMMLKSEKGIKDNKVENYKFGDSKEHWAGQYIEQLSALGYINGYPDGTFMPDYNIKRAESVALINRALDRGPLYDAKPIFPDVPKTYWAYKDIAEGAIDHVFTIDSDGNERLKEILGE